MPVSPIKATMRKSAAYLVIIFLIMSCNNSVSERYEGFNDSTLIVVVTEYIPQTDNNPPDKILSILTEKSGFRAFKIMACYVTVHIDTKKVSPEADALLNKTINDIIALGKITRSDCNDEGDCVAESEYNVKNLFEVIESINSRQLPD